MPILSVGRVPSLGKITDIISNFLNGHGSGSKSDSDDDSDYYPGVLLSGALNGGSPGSASEHIAQDFDQIARTSGSSASGNVSSSSHNYFSGTDYTGLWDYLQHSLATVGAENEINRQYNSAEAALNRDFQAAEAQKQRQWQTEMSNTAYQRAMSDAKAAGLNPILMASNGGAQSGAGASASGSSASYNVGGGDTLSSLINSIANTASSIAQIGEAVSSFLPSRMLKGFIDSPKKIGKIGFR